MLRDVVTHDCFSDKIFDVQRLFTRRHSLPPLISTRTPDGIFVNAWHPG